MDAGRRDFLLRAGAVTSGAALVLGVGPLPAAEAGTVGTVPAPSGRDDTAATVAAIEAVRNAGGGTVVFPPGVYRLSAGLPAFSGITYEMTGATLSFGGAGSMHGFFAAEATNPDAPLTDTVWRGGVLLGTGVQGGRSKAFFAQYLLRPQWIGVEVRDWPATGFGCDYMRNYVFAYCRAFNCGRLGAVGGPGMSGFGIGTGAYEIEDGVLLGVLASGNKNYGIFFEQQGEANNSRPYLSRGMRVIASCLTGNNWGLGDSGVDGLVVEGCTLAQNAADGITVDQGTGGGIGRPGRGGLISGNAIRGNGRYGVFLDYRFKSGSDAASGYVITGNQIVDNALAGVQLSTDTATVHGVTVSSNVISANGACGVQSVVLSTGQWQDLSLTDNQVDRNGQRAVSGYTQGIRVEGRTTRLRVRDNFCYDSGAVKKQSTGLKLGAQTHTDPIIADNDLRGNASTAGLDMAGATLAGLSVVRQNRGHNPRGRLDTPALPASDIPYTNTTGYDCTVYVRGGAVTSISLGAGGGFPTGATGGPIRVPAGQSVYLRYTAAPTWTWFAD